MARDLSLQRGEQVVVERVPELLGRSVEAGLDVDPLATPLDLQIANVTVGVSLGLVMGALGVECIRQVLHGGPGPLGPHRWMKGQ